VAHIARMLRVTGYTATPAPSLTGIARRLGLKSTSVLTRRFPDLSTELKRHRQAALDNGLPRFT
jgi:hypothetical protein